MVALQLTTEQRAALRQLTGAEAVPVFDPGENRAYFLVPADVYERLRDNKGGDGVEHFYPLMNEVARREGW